MASTDAKSGFRLPWSADRNDPNDPATTSNDQAVDQAQPQGAVDENAASSDATATAGDVQGQGSDAAAPTADATPTSDAPSASPAPPRKSNKFMADLTKAMQAAAEAARGDVLEKFNTEAKAHIEAIHASTADEATQLRNRADDDTAAIREWSKNEIARIREETDERIAHRKDVLEREIEAHAAQIEARIERVQSRVTSFEAEMAAFFERLLAEEDPTRFAAMAETLPEPPSFDGDVEFATTEWSAPVETPAENPVEVEPAAQPADAWGTAEYENAYASASTDTTVPAEPSGWESPTSVEAPVAEEAVEAPVAEALAETRIDASAEPFGWQTDTPVEDAPADAETPAVEATVEPTHDDAGDLFSMAGVEPVTDPQAIAETDPRLSAIGIEGDFASAEAEAAAFTAEVPTEEQEIPTIAEDALAARLAGLVAEEPSAATPDEATSTRVVVTGLVSVASIAGFKRNLARVDGVRSVGVSSGPDGEFVFAVTHDAALDLSGGIATLPGFGARVTNEAPGELTVAARDPESEG
jgi:hypothetical protein